MLFEGDLAVLGVVSSLCSVPALVSVTCEIESMLCAGFNLCSAQDLVCVMRRCKYVLCAAFRITYCQLKRLVASLLLPPKRDPL